jgi:NADH-quinone oxidoreductase subunit A
MPPVGDARTPVGEVLQVDDFSSSTSDCVPHHRAIAFRELGIVGYWQIVTFFGLLLTGYVYVWRKGAFDWGRERQR